jgi:hypothetical protein
MHRMLLEWIKKTSYATTCCVYLLVSVAIFEHQNVANFHDPSILGENLTKHDFESPALE